LSPRQNSALIYHDDKFRIGADQRAFLKRLL
jgi:hypothetical protein